MLLLLLLRFCLRRLRLGLTHSAVVDAAAAAAASAAVSAAAAAAATAAAAAAAYGGINENCCDDVEVLVVAGWLGLQVDSGSASTFG